MHIHSSVPFHLFPGSEFRSIRKDMKAPPHPRLENLDRHRGSALKHLNHLF